MAVLNRKNSPISNTAGDTNISKGTLSKRCSESFDAALRIHGETASNTVPAAAGLVETLVVNTISRKRRELFLFFNVSFTPLFYWICSAPVLLL